MSSVSAAQALDDAAVAISEFITEFYSGQEDFKDAIQQQQNQQPQDTMDMVNRYSKGVSAVVGPLAWAGQKAYDAANKVKLARELGVSVAQLEAKVGALGAGAVGVAFVADMISLFDKFLGITPGHFGDLNDSGYHAFAVEALKFFTAVAVTAFVLAVVALTLPEVAAVYAIVHIFLSLIEAALDPLVLDLNGDGINLIDVNNGIHFDFAGDQFAELTGWAAADDGFLVLDKNGNGTIDNIGEMFGNPIWDPKESIQTGNATIDGFAALAALDTNQDGKIDTSDAQFAKLQVWQDLNQNGITDPGELKTLAELGIVSIDLQATSTNVGATGNETSDIGTATQIGNIITATSTYTNADGSTGVIADVSFERETASTVYTGDFVPNFEAALEPQLQGYGTLKPLFIAMSDDPTLLQMMQDFSSSDANATDLLAQIKAILYEWAGVDALLPNYAYINTYATADVRDQIFIDQFMGQIWWINRQDFINLPRNATALAWIEIWAGGGQWAGGAIGNTPNVLEGMENLAQTLINELALRLLIQGPWANLFPDLHYSLSTDSFTGTIDLSSAAALIAGAPQVGSDGDLTALKSYWNLVADAINTAIKYVTVDAGLIPALMSAAVASGLSLTVAQTIFATDDHHIIDGTAGNDTLSGTAGVDLADGGAGDDVINASFNDDIISGNTGNDTLNGGDGNDAYYYIRGDGHDIINEQQLEGTIDQLFLVGVLPSQVTGIRNGNGITLVISESMPGAGDGGSITLTNSLETSLFQGVEQITFSNGTVWTQQDLRDLADTLTSADENIIGLQANDKYSYTRGGGNDTITEAWVNGLDTVALHNVTTGSVSLVRNGNDLLLVIRETSPGAGDGGSILLKASLNDYVQEGVEQITFDDGTVWTRETMRQMLLAQASTNGNDAINGFNSADVVTGGKGDDSLYGGEGNDIYVYRRGDGHDVVDESSLVSGIDKLILADILPSQIKVIKIGEDMKIIIKESSLGAGDGGSIILILSIEDYASRGMEFIQFADGTIWARPDIIAATINHAPSATDDAGFMTVHNAALTIAPATLLGNDTDQDGDALAITNVGNATHGRVFISGTGDVIFMPDADYIGPASFTYTVSDGQGGIATATVTISVQGVAGQTITGTSAANTLTGTTGDDTIYGLGGNDTLNGNGGVDRLIGGTGTDTYIVDSVGDATIELANEGTDTVQSSISWTLAANIEKLTLTGGGNLTGIGNELANTLTGNAGNNALDGGSGADRMVGGLGDDTYSVDDAGDVVVEAASAGTDGVYASLSWALAGNVENLNLTGSADLNGTGNSLANIITGNSGNNILNGAGGADTLVGGAGDDIYIVNTALDVVSEYAGQGVDSVQSSVTYTLAAHVENLTLTGTGSTSGTGNDLDNIIIGNSGGNKLFGLGGNDTLQGSTGNDTLTGGTGNDTFAFLAGFGKDVIADFQAGSGATDVISLSLGTSFDSFAEVMAATSQVGANAIITIDALNIITLKGINKAGLVSDDFLFA
jgi:Ca2+-binding RTX toxin-like protein